MIVYQVEDASGNTATCAFSVDVFEKPEILVDSIIHDMNGLGVGSVFISVSGSGGYSYSWSKDGQLFSQLEDITGLFMGLYSLYVVDSNGCITSSLPIVISNYLGIDDLASSSWVRLKPNPANSYVKLECNGMNIEFISIFDLHGRQIKTIQRPEPLSNIDISELPESVYFLKLLTDQGEAYSFKFSKTDK